MDLDHLKKLVDACHEEAEQTNDTIVSGAALDAYLITVEPAKSLAADRDRLKQHVRQLVSIIGRNNGWLTYTDQQTLREAREALEQGVLP